MSHFSLLQKRCREAYHLVVWIVCSVGHLWTYLLGRPHTISSAWIGWCNRNLHTAMWENRPSSVVGKSVHKMGGIPAARGKHATSASTPCSATDCSCVTSRGRDTSWGEPWVVLGSGLSTKHGLAAHDAFSGIPTQCDSSHQARNSIQYYRACVSWVSWGTDLVWHVSVQQCIRRLLYSAIYCQS